MGQGILRELLVLLLIRLLPGLLFSLPASATPGVESSTDRASAPFSKNGPLRVDVAEAVANAKLFPIWILERNPGLEDLVPRTPGHEYWISIRIEGATYKYRVLISAMRDGKKIDSASDIFSCECNSETLLEIVDEGIARAVERFELSPGPSRGSVDAMSISDSPSGLGQEPSGGSEKAQPETRRLQLSVPGYLGVGMGVAGVGAVVAGIPLMRRPTSIDGKPQGVHVTSYRNSGIVLAAVGGAGVLAGAIMVAVDVVSRRAKRSSIAPMVNPQIVGISLCGEF